MMVDLRVRILSFLNILKLTYVFLALIDQMVDKKITSTIKPTLQCSNLELFYCPK